MAFTAWNSGVVCSRGCARGRHHSTKPRAEWLCRTANWVHTTGVPGSHYRSEPAAPSSSFEKLFRLLPSLANAPRVGEGRSGLAVDYEARRHRGSSAGRRLAPPLRATCCIAAEEQYGNVNRSALVVTDGWYRDTATWPKDRGFEVFPLWFDYQHHSMLIDLCHEPLILGIKSKPVISPDRTTQVHDLVLATDRMSFRLAIPWRVGLHESPPPLHQPGAILQQTNLAVQ